MRCQRRKDLRRGCSLLAVAAAVANGMENEINVAAASFMNQVGTIVLSTNPKSLNSL